MAKSIIKLRTLDPGVATANIFTARVGFADTEADTATQTRFFEALAPRLAALPGVQAVALSSQTPATCCGGSNFAIEGKQYEKDRDYPYTQSMTVSDGFFPTFKVAALQGRVFSTDDKAESVPVVIVNQSFVRKHFASENPLGRRIRLGGAKSTKPWRTIVGVVPDIFTGDPGNPRDAGILIPLTQDRSSTLSMRICHHPACSGTNLPRGTEPGDDATGYRRVSRASTSDLHLSTTAGALTSARSQGRRVDDLESSAAERAQEPRGAQRVELAYDHLAHRAQLLGELLLRHADGNHRPAAGVGPRDQIFRETRRNWTERRAIESLDQLTHALAEPFQQHERGFRIRFHRGDEDVAANECTYGRLGGERGCRVATAAEHGHFAERSSSPFDVHDLRAIGSLPNDSYFPLEHHQKSRGGVPRVEKDVPSRKPALDGTVGDDSEGAARKRRKERDGLQSVWCDHLSVVERPPR